MSEDVKQERKEKKVIVFHKLDYRCAGNCNRLLFRASLMPGSTVDIRCPKCNTMNVIGVGFYSTSILTTSAGAAVATISANGVEDE